MRKKKEHRVTSVTKCDIRGDKKGAVSSLLPPHSIALVWWGPKELQCHSGTQGPEDLGSYLLTVSPILSWWTPEAVMMLSWDSHKFS